MGPLSLLFNLTNSVSIAEDNAHGWLETIVDYFQIYQFIDNSITGSEMNKSAKQLMRSELGFDGNNTKIVLNNLEERIQGCPLSIQIRSGWYSPGSNPEPREFEILLSTGGPALRIIGELNQFCEPMFCELQYQNWGIPWTEFPCEQEDALLWFCQQFYYGE